MPPPIFPLRWESTGDQWWYASPIDWAAANGLYDVVLELLHQDTNLLIKLTSLRRLRRLETVWNDDEEDDSSSFRHVSLGRCHVAKKLLEECWTDDGNNSLIRAGYGGWLLYTAASAGDLGFAKKLLEIDPLLVFGEGEYGVTDILYAAGRGKNGDVFRLILDFALLPAGISLTREAEDEEEELSERQLAVRVEMMTRAVHGAARGGNVAMLEELLLMGGRSAAVLNLRDAYGGTVLHSAAGRGKLEVVKHLLSTYATTVTLKDNLGNTALHVAAYKGHLTAVKALVIASPTLVSATNNHGNTFLHMAVSGFRTPGFKRVDRQMELMRQLVTENFVNLQEIVNARNKDCRTAIHLAVMDEINAVRPDVVELLMKVPCLDLNILDVDGMTPLDLLDQQRPRSLACEILMKRLISAGGRTNLNHFTAKDKSFHRPREEPGFCGSPGTSFKISDSEIFLYAGTDIVREASPERESMLDEISICSSETSGYSDMKPMDLKQRRMGTRLKFLLRWTKREEAFKDERIYDDDDDKKREDRRVSLRDIYSSPKSLEQQDKTISTKNMNSELPSLSVRMKFTERLMKGVVVHRSPRFVFSPPVATFSRSPLDFLSSEKDKDMEISESDKISIEKKYDKKFMNRYFCFGTQGLHMEDDIMNIDDSSHRSFTRTTSLIS